MSQRVAVVTGANRGLGYHIVKALCTPGATQFKGIVYLTARSKEKGEAAAEALRKENLKVSFRLLDVSSKDSIEQMKKYLQDKYKGLDVLINNAGVFPKDPAIPFVKRAEDTISMNYFSIVNVSKILFPILKRHSRVVHVSSSVCSDTLIKCGHSLQSNFKQDMNFDKLDKLMSLFVKDAKEGSLKKHGWPDFPYGVSKIGVTWLAPLQQREVDKKNEDIIVNACCPGWVSTDMGGEKAPKKGEEGADTPIYLALLEPKTASPRGKFVMDRTIQQWP